MTKEQKKTSFIFKAEAEKALLRKVKRIGNSAQVTVPKDFLNKEVFVIVPAGIKANSTKG